MQAGVFGLIGHAQPAAPELFKNEIVWPTNSDGVAVGGNVKSNIEERSIATVIRSHLINERLKSRPGNWQRLSLCAYRSGCESFLASLAGCKKSVFGGHSG